VKAHVPATLCIQRLLRDSHGTECRDCEESFELHVGFDQSIELCLIENGSRAGNPISDRNVIPSYIDTGPKKLVRDLASLQIIAPISRNNSAFDEAENNNIKPRKK
jgi:hypothetical protein